MHLAILMTNTDESAFAQAHPKDGEKFTTLVHSVQPDWTLTSYAVKDGIFPADITAFDGIIITGSPASVLDDEAWIARLLEEIRKAYAAGIPMFGACFGHQAIALALGGTVERDTNGWAFGLVEMSVTDAPAWYDGPAEILQYGAHLDQVTKLPTGAQRIFVTNHCPNAGFAIGNRVYTTQNHPEMTPDFMAALTAEYGPKLGTDIATRAKASLEREADTALFARSIAQFFKNAAA